MKELIRKLGQYINNNNDKLAELIYYILCRIEYDVKFKIKLK